LRDGEQGGKKDVEDVKDLNYILHILYIFYILLPPLRHPFKVAQNTVYLGKGADARERPFQQAQSGRKGVDEGRRAPR
jgi:hypothetical protein